MPGALPAPGPSHPGHTHTWAAVLLQLLHVASSTPLPGGQTRVLRSHSLSHFPPSLPAKAKVLPGISGWKEPRPKGRGWVVVVVDTRGCFCREPRGHQGLGSCFGEYGAGPRRGETHLWKTRASTVMAASRRKASAPRMDPTTKESLSGSWADSSPGEPATHSHRCGRSHTPVQTSHTAPQAPTYPHPLPPQTRRSVDSQSPSLEGLG